MIAWLERLLAQLRWGEYTGVDCSDGNCDACDEPLQCHCKHHRVNS